MKTFEMLCVTVGRTDVSFIKEMNLDSDIIVANQNGDYSLKTEKYKDYQVKVISTPLLGVGKNRNTALLYATADICLLADDDLVYRDGYKYVILDEFEKYPEADIIIFNIGTTTPEHGRIPTVTQKNRYLKKSDKLPYGAPRVAFRRECLERANICFSTLFGGGTLFSSGEDTLFLTDALNKGLKVLLSTGFIGDVSYNFSTSYTSDIDKKLYDIGALLEARQIGFKFMYTLYYARKYKTENISFFEAVKKIKSGRAGFKVSKHFTGKGETNE